MNGIELATLIENRRFYNPQSHEKFTISLSRLHYFVPFDSTPGRYIGQSSGVSAENFELISWQKIGDLILRANDRHWAQKVASI